MPRFNRNKRDCFYINSRINRMILFGICLSFFLISIFSPPFVYAQINTKETLDWFTMFMWLSGGLALFLFGMEQMIKGLLVIAGDQMKNRGRS